MGGLVKLGGAGSTQLPLEPRARTRGEGGGCLLKVRRGEGPHLFFEATQTLRRIAERYGESSVYSVAPMNRRS